MNCQNLNTLPDISFKIEGKLYNFTYLDYVVAIETHKKNNFGNCLFGFYEMNIEKPNGPSWILGSMFMSKFYIVFDFEKKQIGFANKK